MTCPYCSVGRPVRDSRGCCRNCGGALPAPVEEPTVDAPKASNFEAMADFYAATGPAYYKVPTHYLRPHIKP